MAETDDAPAEDVEDDESGPFRRCIATGERQPKARLLRFVVAPDGTLTPDLAARLPGRGIWLTATREALALAIKKKAFSRAARGQVGIPPDLADRIETLLARRCLDAIGLARRADRAVAGYEKVREALRAAHGGGSGAILLAAADGAEDGIRKLAALAPDLPTLRAFDAATLGKAFGRDHIVHALIAPGPLARRLAEDAGRLAGFRVADATLAPRAQTAPDRTGDDGV
jgi:predicted RNA-binding protein YlxR (DUF448 family)